MTCADTSRVAVEQMASKFVAYDEMECTNWPLRLRAPHGRRARPHRAADSVMDATDLSALPPGVFDLVVDKGASAALPPRSRWQPRHRCVLTPGPPNTGLLDSVLCGERAYTRVTQMVGEMLKVLKPDGAFVVVSHGAPATRQAYLEGEGTSVEVHEVPKPTDETFTDVGAHSSFFVYVVTKK